MWQFLPVPEEEEKKKCRIACAVMPYLRSSSSHSGYHKLQYLLGLKQKDEGTSKSNDPKGDSVRANPPAQEEEDDTTAGQTQQRIKHSR